MDSVLKRPLVQRASLAMVATGVALGLAGPIAYAQDDAATPAAAVEATPAESAAPVIPAAEKVDLAEQIQTLTDAIAVLQKDREAIASSGDVTQIDALLSKAAELRDSAQTALASDDVSAAPEALMTAGMLLDGARSLIQAEASAYGMPSQQAETSRVLVNTYYAIDEAISATTPETDATQLFAIDTAKALYARAYEQYNAGTYARAEGVALVASNLLTIANVQPIEVRTVEPGADGTGAGTMEVAPPAVVIEGDSDPAVSGGDEVNVDAGSAPVEPAVPPAPVMVEGGTDVTGSVSMTDAGEVVIQTADGTLVTGVLVVPGLEAGGEIEQVPPPATTIAIDPNQPLMDGTEIYMVDPETGEITVVSGGAGIGDEKAAVPSVQIVPADGSGAIDGGTYVRPPAGSFVLRDQVYPGIGGVWSPAELIVDESRVSPLDVPAPEWT